MNAPDRPTNLRVNPDWAKLPLFDRSKWERVRFGDVVDNLNETCDPNEAGIQRYIGLEHLEPGSLHIRSWGNVSDGTTFTRRARPGQVLFGKRRAYQRKVVVASFDAVVSGDIYVLTAKTDRLLGELLPFLCMSDRFFNHAVGTSAGSLSPRTNWSSLASFEFDLPPLEQQRRVSVVLNSLDAVLQSELSLAQATEKTLEATAIHHFAAESSRASLKRLEEVAVVAYGITLGQHRETMPLERPYLRVANVQREAFDLAEVKHIRCTDSEVERFTLRNGDVLIVEGHADVDEIGRAAVWRTADQGWLHQNHLIRARCSSVLVPEYLSLFVNSPFGRAYFRGRAKSTSGLNTINSTVVKELLVPVPSLENQQSFLTRVNAFRDSQLAAAAHAAATRQTMIKTLSVLVADVH